MIKSDIVLVLIFVCLAFAATQVQAQIPTQINLEDVQIKGEGSGSKFLNISSRQKNDISDRVKLKSSFVTEMIEELPPGFTSDPEAAAKKK